MGQVRHMGNIATGGFSWVYFWMEQSKDTGDPGRLIALEIDRKDVLDLDPRWAGDFRYTHNEKHRYQLEDIQWSYAKDNKDTQL